jgi:hypothetical protein
MFAERAHATFFCLDWESCAAMSTGCLNVQTEKPPKAANLAQYVFPKRPLRKILNALLRPVAGRNIHAGIGIRHRRGLFLRIRQSYCPGERIRRETSQKNKFSIGEG